MWGLDVPSDAGAVTRERTVVSLIVGTLAWGVLLFGSVYPWAYAVMATAALISGVIAIRSAGPVRVPSVWLVASAAVVLVAGCVQLVPLSGDRLQAMSPATVGLLRQVDLQFALGLRQVHALSIDTGATITALLLYAVLAVFAAGVARWCSAAGTRSIGTALTALGAVVALIGIIQRPLYAGKIYGIWTPFQAGEAFGPFVNRNHFAGWMMMCLPVTLGLLFSSLETGMRGLKPGWRRKMAWFDSPDASRLLLLGGAAVVMGLALVLTTSRSGIGAFGFAVCVAAGLFVFKVHGLSRRAIGAVYLTAFLLLITGWVGLDVIVDRFGQTNWSELQNRRGAWEDARRVAAMFPLAGTGLGTYGTAMLIYQQHGLPLHFAQAHNDYLQLLAEGGWLIAVPVALLVILATLHIAARFREEGSANSQWVRAGAVTGLIAVGLQEIVDFSLQMPGNAALFAALMGLALHRAPASRRGRVRPE